MPIVISQDVLCDTFQYLTKHDIEKTCQLVSTSWNLSIIDNSSRRLPKRLFHRLWFDDHSGSMHVSLGHKIDDKLRYSYYESCEIGQHPQLGVMLVDNKKPDADRTYAD